MEERALDRIRRQAGADASPCPAPSPSTSIPRSNGALEDLLSASRSAPVGLGELRLFAWSTIGVLTLVAVLYSTVTNWVASSAGSNGFFAWRWAYSVLTFLSANTWLPWVMAAAVVVLVVMAIKTDGFAAGRHGDVVAIGGACSLGAVSCIPALIALAIGVVVLAVIIALAALALVLMFVLIGAALDS